MGVFEKILIVCIGNICCSTMAAAILKNNYLAKYIESAGLSALVDHFADAKAV